MDLFTSVNKIKLAPFSRPTSWTGYILKLQLSNQTKNKIHGF